jgi:predicted DNA-binding transcriptional regulator AlpA
MKSRKSRFLGTANNGAASPASNLHAHQLINARQLMTLLPVSRMTIWRLEKQGRVPRHIRIGGRNYWRLSEITESISKLSEPKLFNGEIL